MSRSPLIVRNGFCRLPPETPPDLVKAVDEQTAYLVAGHEMALPYKRGWWDGREHLVKFSKRDNCFKFPTGLLGELLKRLPEEFDVQDERRQPSEKRDIAFIGPEPRDYQLGAVEAAEAARGPGGISTGRGLLNLPIRSGKTLIASLIISRTGLRTVFVVPSDMLLTQTKKAFQEFLSPAPVSIFGHEKPGFITVATNQMLIARPKAALELLRETDQLIVDEAHHLEAPAWRMPLLAADSLHKIGLSATIFGNKDIPTEQSAIWLRAVTGPILYRVAMKELIDRQFLVAPQIIVYPVKKPEGMETKYSFKNAYEKLIAANHYRNSGIADLVEQGVSSGMKVLVDTGRLNQMRTIQAMLNSRGIEVRAIFGGTSAPQRAKILKDFQNGKIQCLVGTVLGEGIDIPELEMVINAEGMRSKKAVIQRMRNLTPSEGKEMAVFIDFLDYTNEYLAEHSAERVSMYRSTRGFKLHAGRVDETGKFILG